MMCARFSLRISALALLLLGVQSFDMWTVTNDTSGGVSVQRVDTKGNMTLVAPNVFQGAFTGAITADVASNVVYVTNGTLMVALDAVSGSVLKSVGMAAGTVLCHISYDYKGAAAGAPGHTLYGLVQNSKYEVTMVHFDSSLQPVLITTLNTTGTVSKAYLGLPKPHLTEPENKHYGMIISPAGATPASSPVMIFMDLRGTYHHWGHVQADITIAAFAMDYDHHNVYATLTQPQGSQFAIIHMLGTLQQVLSTSPTMRATSVVSPCTIDMVNEVYYNVELTQQEAIPYLNGYDFQGKVVSSYRLVSEPHALYFDATFV